MIGKLNELNCDFDKQRVLMRQSRVFASHLIEGGSCRPLTLTGDTPKEAAQEAAWLRQEIVEETIGKDVPQAFGVETNEAVKASNQIF